RANLRQAAFLGSIADGGRVGALDRAAFFRVGQVVGLAVFMLHHPGGAFGEHALEVLVGKPDVAAAAGSGRNVAKELVDQLANLRSDFINAQRTAEQPHSSIDVKADPARRNHAAFVGSGGGDATDREAVTLME